uniref:Nuclear receptor coactivator 4 N-terminal domain-containing protein n=1 Tax=Cricetulus griseus TaxID=10029 RepID=A0A8C2M5P6_CRIGR
MNTSLEQSGCYSNRETLLRCSNAGKELELAIGRVLQAEQQIRDDLRKVKAQIHSCISSHLECLQSREVDLIHQLKEETLQQQAQQLYWLVYQFSCLTHQLELGSLALTPEDSTILLLFEAPEHLMAHTSSSNIGEKRGYIQVPEQKSASSSTAQMVLVSKLAIGHQAPYVLSTNPQDWLTPKQNLESSQTSARACSFFSNAWGNIKDIPGKPSSSKFNSHCSTSLSGKARLSDWLVTPQEPCELEKPENGSCETHEKFKLLFQVFKEPYNVNDWLAKPDSCTNCQGNQPKGVEIENLGNLKCLNDHLEAKNTTVSSQRDHRGLACPEPSGPM